MLTILQAELARWQLDLDQRRAELQAIEQGAEPPAGVDLGDLYEGLAYAAGGVQALREAIERVEQVIIS